MAARAKLKAWLDVDALFASRNWLGFTKKKSPLSFQRVVDILQKNSAPTHVSYCNTPGAEEVRDIAISLLLIFDHWLLITCQVLQDYVALVDDGELRLTLAQKHKCHDIVINVSLPNLI